MCYPTMSILWLLVSIDIAATIIKKWWRALPRQLNQICFLYFQQNLNNLFAISKKNLSLITNSKFFQKLIKGSKWRQNNNLNLKLTHANNTTQVIGGLITLTSRSSFILSPPLPMMQPAWLWCTNMRMSTSSPLLLRPLDWNKTNELPLVKSSLMYINKIFFN